MGVKEGISAWMKKRKARKIALNIESKYSIEISLLKELAEDLEALLHLVSVKSKDLEKESRNYLLHIFRVYRKLARLEKRVFREERKIEEHFLSDLQGKLSDKYDSKSHLKDILDRLHAENNSLLKALSGFHGRLGIDLKNIGTEADFLSSARGHGNLHDDQELWRLKGDLESEIGLIKELIGFAHAAIIDFDSLEKEAVLLSRRKFMLGAGATAAVAATMKLGDFFEEAKVNFQFSSATEGRAVFLIKSKKDGVEFVAIKLRQGWSYSRIAELYCKKGKGAVSVLKEYNDNIGEISVGDYLFFPKGELALDVLRYLEKEDFVSVVVDAGNTLLDFVKNNLNYAGKSYSEALRLMILFSSELPYGKPMEDFQLAYSIKIVVPRDLYFGVNEGFEVPSIERYVVFQTPVKKKWEEVKAIMNPYLHNWHAKRVRIGGKVTIHEGLDVPGPVGDVLYSIGFGVVEAVKTNWTKKDKKNKVDKWRNGNFVKIKLFYRNLKIYYLHMDKVFVKKGDLVTLNTRLGTIGITGNASRKNPHVHISLYRGSKVIDPTPYVSGKKNVDYIDYVSSKKDLSLAFHDALKEEKNRNI